MKPLSVAIVGHSNVGKTSLVAALTRDATLDVREEAGTTRSYYERVFALAGEAVLAFVDTPGFETAGRINRLLDAGDPEADGRALLEGFLADPQQDDLFREEKEALRGALAADVLAYVADVTAPPSGQQRQEIRLLRRAGVPIIAILNVLAEADEREAWMEVLRRENVDTIVPLDAWVFPAEQEQRFYRALGVLRPEHAAALERISSLRRSQAQARRSDAARAVASLLVDCLSYRLVEEFPSEAEANRGRDAANDRFKRTLRHREQAAVAVLAEDLGFPTLEVEGEHLSVESWSGTWQGDLFDPAQLRRYGVSAGTLAVVGALTGSVVDAVGGLGLGTLLGAGVGVAAGLALGRRVSTSVDGNGRLAVGPVDAVQFPSLLLHRAVELWAQLHDRSHARRDPVRRQGDDPGRLGAAGVAKLNRLARSCRKHPGWSALSGPVEGSAERSKVLGELAALVEAQLEAVEGSTKA